MVEKNGIVGMNGWKGKEGNKLSISPKEKSAKLMSEKKVGGWTATKVDLWGKIAENV